MQHFGFFSEKYSIFNKNNDYDVRNKPFIINNQQK